MAGHLFWACSVCSNATSSCLTLAHVLQRGVQGLCGVRHKHGRYLKVMFARQKRICLQDTVQHPWRFLQVCVYQSCAGTLQAAAAAAALDTESTAELKPLAPDPPGLTAPPAQVQLHPTHLPLLMHLGDCLVAAAAVEAATAPPAEALDRAAPTGARLPLLHRGHVRT